MFSLIVCTDNQFGIGMSDGTIPFKNSSDLKNFKNLTTGNIVIMGRKTWDSLPQKPLPNRVNMVISSKGYDILEDVEIKELENSKTLETSTKIAYLNAKKSPVIVCPTVEDCLVELSKKEYSLKKYKEVFIIGGATLYNYFIINNLVQKIYHTKVDNDFECDVKMVRFNVNKNFSNKIDNEILLAKKDIICYDKTIYRWDYNVYIFVNNEENKFLDILEDILKNGSPRDDRTEIGTRAVFGKFLEFDISNNTFPLGTTKQVPFRQVFEELMWFLRGQTNARILSDKGVYIWNGNTSREFLDKQGLTSYKEGEIGPSYGFLLRHFGAEYINSDTNYEGQGIDQLNEAIRLIKENPHSRRIIINLWNPAVINKCALPPCLFNYQFYVEDDTLSCLMTQRSSDISLAGFWNIATGTLLTCLIARVTGLRPKTLKWSIGDAHIYNNQIDAVKKQLKRCPRAFPKLIFNHNAPSLKNGRHITEFEFEDLCLVGYNPYPSIKSVMNV